MATKKKTTPKKVATKKSKGKNLAKALKNKYGVVRGDIATRFQPGVKSYLFRTKHGRDALFTTPELLWEEACKYFQYVDDNPWYEHKPMVVSNGGNMGSSVEMQMIPKRLPYTLTGLCLYLDVNEDYFTQFKESNTYKSNPDFSRVLDAIKKMIYDQKFNGAAAGFFNSNIIAYDLGLVKKVDVVSNGEPIKAPEFKVYNNAPPLSDSEDKVDKTQPKKKEG